jgi:hypothetical protein
VRNHVAVPTDGHTAELELSLDLDTWADICSARTTVAAAIEEGRVTVNGALDRVDRVLGCFDHPSFGG